MLQITPLGVDSPGAPRAQRGGAHGSKCNKLGTFVASGIPLDVRGDLALWGSWALTFAASTQRWARRPVLPPLVPLHRVPQGRPTRFRPAFRQPRKPFRHTDHLQYFVARLHSEVFRENIHTSEGSTEAKFIRRSLLAQGAYQVDSASGRIRMRQDRSRANKKRIGRPPALPLEQVEQCRRSVKKALPAMPDGEPA